MATSTSFLKKAWICVLSVLLALSTTIGSLPLTAMAEDQTPEQAAAQYIQDKIINGKDSSGDPVNIFGSFTQGCQRSDDGLTYNIAYEYQRNSYSDPSEITYLRMNTTTSVFDTTQYKFVWTSDGTVITPRKTAVSNTRFDFTRPTADQDTAAGSITLSLYSTDTTDDAVSSGTATPLASQTFAVNILPAPKTYNVTFVGIDSVNNKAVPDFSVKVNKGDSPYLNSVDANSDGSFTLRGDAFYTITATGTDYEQYSKYPWTPSEDGTVRLPMVAKQYKYVTFNPVNASDNSEAVANAKVTVKKDYTTISAETSGDHAGAYKLEVGKSYTVSATADGYEDYSGTLSVTSDTPETSDIAMVKLVYHYVTISPVNSSDGSAVSGATVTVKQGYYDTVDPETTGDHAGSYKLAEGVSYDITIAADGYADYSEDSYTIPSGSDEAYTYTAKLDPIHYCVTTVKVVNAYGEEIPGAAITVRSGGKYGTKIAPELDGTYKLDSRYNAYCEATAATYEKTGVSVTANSDDTQTVTITMHKNISKYYTTITPVDAATGQEISGATITVTYEEEDYWGDSETKTVSQNANGTYSLQKNTEFTITVTAPNYNQTVEKFTPSGEEDTITKTISMSHAQSVAKFNVTDKDSGAAIENAAIVVKKGSDVVAPEADGSYKLDAGSEYTYTVSADTYVDATGTVNISADKTIDVQMSHVTFQTYNITIAPTDNASGAAIAGAKVTVTYMDEDEWGDDVEETVNPSSDGSYSLSRYIEYTIAVTADGYNPVKMTYKPDGYPQAQTLTVGMDILTADQKKVNVAVAAFDAELGALRPHYGTDTNINDFALGKIKAHTDLDTDGLTVSLVNAADSTYIAQDGTINYNQSELDNYGINVKNVDCVFKVTCGDASATTASRTATIGWDVPYFQQNMQAEADQVTESSILGSNASASEVTSDLSLPRSTGTNARKVWSEIEWTSSNPDVIGVQITDGTGINTAAVGKVNRTGKDETVTLTATFKANDTVLNSYVENQADFGTITKTFTVTVKADPEKVVTPEKLQSLLDQYYPESAITIFGSDPAEPVDPAAVTTDIQLPRYTKIKNADGNYVFKNGEITVTSGDPDTIAINGYRGEVDRFQNAVDTPVTLTVTLTRDGVTASKDIVLNVKPVTDEELDQELAMMQVAKDNYFAGINDNRYKNEKSITGDLHPFQEMNLDADGNATFAYSVSDMTGQGIIPDGYFDDPWAMEQAGYNKFKSSDTSIISHEALVVTPAKDSKHVTVTSWLSSEKFGKFAPKHADNAKLQQLYRQEVSANLVVVGTEAVPQADEWVRVSGDTRYDTMAEVVKTGNFEGSDTVIIASGKNFPDALSASGLAGLYNAPIILVNDQLAGSQAEALLDQIKPANAIIVGGSMSVSDSIALEIANKGINVSRSFGEMRYDTSVQIYKDAIANGKQWGDTAILVSGNNYPDALSIAPFAYAAKAPVFLTNFDNGLSSDTAAALANFDKIVIVGGEKSVPQVVENQLKATSGASIVRLAGEDRYQTCSKVNAWETGMDSDAAFAPSVTMSWNTTAVASAENYPDSLVSSPTLGKAGGVLVLADGSALGHYNIDNTIKSNIDTIGNAYIFGGPAAVSNEIKAELDGMLG